LILAASTSGWFERIDAENGAGDRGRHLEPEKFLADVVRSTS